MSLVIALLMYFGLPESLKFLILRKRNPENVEKWLRRIDATAPSGSDVEYVIQEEDRKGVPVLHLLREGRAWVTLLLWTVNFMNLLILWSLSSWLPTIIREAGYSTSNAVLVGASLQMGGVGGVFGLAWVISRSGFYPTLPISFGLACISIALIGQPGISLVLLTAMVFIAGWCVIGSQGGINAVAATYYPTYLRSTGVGWALGVGRFGAIVGPVLGGEALRLQWSAQQLFLAAAVPALISALVMVSLRGMVKGQDSADAKTEVMAH